MRNIVRGIAATSVVAALWADPPTPGGQPAAAAEAESHAESLPQPLSPEDSKRYRRIFDLQEIGDWRQADRVIARLESRILMGHVLAQRYLHPRRYRSKFAELASWMKHYADHPDAKQIHALAVRRKPRRARMPRAPRLPRPVAFTESGDGGIEKVDWSHLRFGRSARKLHARIRSLVHREHLSAAEELAGSEAMKRLGPIHTGIAEARIAAGWFYYGNDARTYEIGRRAAKRAGANAPFGYWYAGLAAFRMGRYAEAGLQFRAMAAIGGQSRWTRSAAAFWAARAGLRAGQPDRMARWLRLAASHPRTFYGILARRTLGAGSPFDWRAPSTANGRVAAALATPRAQRALALVQSGERRRAARELRYLSAGSNADTRLALLVIADRARLPSVALRTAATLSTRNSLPVERALYPVPAWQPRGGFSIDRAVVYAFMRQESAFNPRAESHAGARGLMQLMPRTASYIGNDRYRGRKREELFDPALNLSLGQKYLRYLLQHDQVRGDLFMMAAAYNGGPGNLSRWRRRVTAKTHDPLLTIESLPSRETRDFIERVMSNLWLYRERLGQQAPSLDAIAAGKRPIYRSQDAALLATRSAGDKTNGRN